MSLPDLDPLAQCIAALSGKRDDIPHTPPAVRLTRVTSVHAHSHFLWRKDPGQESLARCEEPSHCAALKL